jgi:hypothetical protein
MVGKIDLARQKNPNPIWLFWFQHRYIEVMMIDQCKVSFNINDSKDETICDVIPMNVFHFFLGIPWCYDRCVVHDGKKNPYTITSDGKRSQWLPMKQDEPKEVLLLSIKKDL